MSELHKNYMKIHETYVIKEFILFSPKTSKHLDKKFPKYF